MEKSFIAVSNNNNSKKAFYKYLVLFSLVLSLMLSSIFSVSSIQKVKASIAIEPNQTGDGQVRIKNFGRVRAPEFEGGKGWLNTDRPLKLAELKGKIVLLDFWTYCCINCIHIIPELKKLEKKYEKELVVIGVHSAKFKNERDSENIRQAILRYEIEHPVVNDSEFEIWSQYTAHAWPTLFLIDPEGYIVDVFSGEGHMGDLDKHIGEIATDFRTKGKLNEEPLQILLEKHKVTSEILSYPGKVLADEKGQRLFISDSNHNRIVITSLSGETLEVIGNGQIGQTDGDFKTATFNHLQGVFLAPDGNTLYVADTENHLIRKVDLKAKTVETIAGTGKQSTKFNEFGPARKVALNSPWDVEQVGNELFIAMAGPHQIWIMDLKTNEIGPFAGSGLEGRNDGIRYKAALAQPSGLTFNGKTLFVADSEISSIRAVDISDQGEVTTVAGSGDLFGFGDQDGTGESVRLQHPLGVEFSNGLVYVADTYNHKIKVIDPKDRTCKTFLGNGKSGKDDGKTPKFYEPSGLSVAGDKLYIADTNNNAIRVADLKTKEVSTLKITGLTVPASASPKDILPNREDVSLKAQKVALGKNEFVLDLKLPSGYHLNPESTQVYRIKPLDNNIQLEENQQTASLKNPHLPLKIPFKASAGAEKATVEVQFTFAYCPIDSTKGACKIKTLVWNVPIEFDKNTKEQSIKIKHEIK
jgi:DNA-binding beta-propeller fold protein YncE/cytochrome oxidase Cu insertion factor (SCO1/SenC/PrrC family)